MARNSECPHCGVVNYCRQQPWCPRRLAQMQCDDHEMAAASALRDNQRLEAYLRMCHQDIDPACPFDTWLEHLEWLRQEAAHKQEIEKP